MKSVSKKELFVLLKEIYPDCPYRLKDFVFHKRKDYATIYIGNPFFSSYSVCSHCFGTYVIKRDYNEDGDLVEDRRKVIKNG